MLKICKKWGIEYPDQFAGATLMRPYNANTHIAHKVEKADVMRLQSELKTELRDMMKQTQNFPK